MRDVRKRAFTTGYLAGLSGMPVVTAPGQSNDPLYLYGGVALPPLPAEWNREEYPYAVITRDSETHMYQFCAYKTVNYGVLNVFGNQTNYFGFFENGTAQIFTAQQGAASWSLSESTLETIIVDKGVYPIIAIWTHGFDLMYSDGTLYVAASAPGRITDWESLRGQSFYNDFLRPWHDFCTPNDPNDLYSRCLIKTETKYLYLFGHHAHGGTFVAIDGDSAYMYKGYLNVGITATSRDIDGGEWLDDSLINYLGEEDIELGDLAYRYLCRKEDIIWSDDDIRKATNNAVAFYGSAPVLVPEPPEVITDNKAVVLGCRLGYIVRSQMKNQSVADGPDGREASESVPACE